MVDRVFVHIGLPKTATSYLQTIIWSNRDELRARGVVVPGRSAATTCGRRGRCARTSQERAPEQHRTAWSRICARARADAHGTGLISHEFFAAAVRRAGRGDGRGTADRRGAPRRDRARAARAVHRQLAGEPEERLDHADARLRAAGVATAPRRSGTGAPSTSGWCSSAGRRPCRPSGSTCWCSTRRRPATTSGTGSPASSGSTRTASTCPGRSRTPRWAWPRPRRCAGSTLGSRASTAPSTRACTSAPSSPTSGWCPRRASGSGPSRTRSRTADGGRGGGRRYLRAGGFDVSGDLEHLRVPESSSRAGTGVGHRRRGGRGRGRPGRDDAGRRTGAADRPPPAARAAPAVRRPGRHALAAPAGRSPTAACGRAALRPGAGAQTAQASAARGGLGRRRGAGSTWKAASAPRAPRRPGRRGSLGAVGERPGRGCPGPGRARREARGRRAGHVVAGGGVVDALQVLLARRRGKVVRGQRAQRVDGGRPVRAVARRPARAAPSTCGRTPRPRLRRSGARASGGPRAAAWRSPAAVTASWRVSGARSRGGRRTSPSRGRGSTPGWSVWRACPGRAAG